MFQIPLKRNILAWQNSISNMYSLSHFSMAKHPNAQFDKSIIRTCHQSDLNDAKKE